MRVENLAYKAVTWVTLLSFFCGFVLTPAYANPEGGVVTGGSATITTDGTRTDIVQTTSKAVIDWRSFDIGAGEHTQFHQPGSSSIALNRINDYKPSQIDGLLTANGKIILINPNGVFFGAGAVVDVNSMLATTTGIDNNSFMKNDVLHFNQSGNADAAIINEGRITAADAGLIGFVAPQVENRGVITAKLGKVHLASGETYTVDLAGDGLINLAVSDNLQKQIVKNSGVISANGGEIHMTAAAARNQVDRLVENSGRLEARSFSQKGGKIVLSAIGQGAKKAQVLNKGVIDVSAAEDSAAGGKVEVLGDHVGLMEDSKILASGQNANGGDVMVGGDYQGLGPTQRADITYVAPNALIDVRANGTGNGGRAIVWADDTTRYYGMIDGRAGDLGGNGGMAEVSGKSYLEFLGNVDLSALNGERGHLLLDPGNIIICQFGVTAGCNPNPAPALTAASNVFTSTATDSYVNIGNAGTAGSLVNLLQSNDVTIATGGAGASAGNITVADAISWTAATTLTLNAHGQIIINAPITGNGITFVSDGDVAINAALTPSGSGTILTIAQKTASRTMGIGGGAGTINISTADISNITSDWGEVRLGTAALTGKMTVGVTGATLNLPFNARFNSAGASAANYLTINGDVVMGGKNLTIAANTPFMNGSIGTIGGGVLTLLARNGAQSICLAASGCGATYSAAMLDKMGIGGWTRVDAGTGGNDAPVLLGSYVWNTNVRAMAREDDVTINGTVDMNGYNLDLIVSGQQQVVIAGTGSVVNANNMSLQGRLGTIINGSINGTGNLTITPHSTTGAWDIAGEVNAASAQLTAASLDNIGADWNKLILSAATATGINVGAYNWRHDVEFRRSANNTTSFLGAQDFGSHDVTLSGIGNYAIGATFSGTGNLTIQGDTAARNLAMGGVGGNATLGISTTSIANIQAGFSNITVGRSDQTGTLTFSGAQTWKSPLHVKTLSGTVTMNALTVSGGHDLTIETDSNLAIGGAWAGTGNLYLRTMSDATPITLGGVVAGSNFTLNQTELNNISNGWAGITIGRETGTGTITAGSRGWNDHLTLQSNTGVITIGGIQYLNGNNLSILSNVGPVINTGIESSPTGTLTLRPLDSTLDIGVAGAAGAYGVSTASLNNITDNWGNIVIGGSNHTGAININAYTNWKDPVSFLRNTANTASAINIAGNQTGTGNASFAFTGNVNLGGNITTNNSAITFNDGLTLTANSTLNSGSALTTLQGVTAGSYAFALAGSGDTQLNGDITSIDSSLDLSRTLTLANNVTLGSGTGAISLKTVNAGVHSLVFTGTGGLNLNGNITSTDTAIDFNRSITLSGNTTLNTGAADISLRSVTMGAYTLGISGSGGLNLYNNITSTDTLLNIGRDATLMGNVTLNTGSGDIYMKAMDMGVHSLAFIGSGGLYLNGDITSTDVALNINRNLILDGDSQISTGIGDITLGNVLLNDKSLTFAGTGDLNLRGDINGSDVDIDFNRNVVLGNDVSIDVGAGDIFAKNIDVGDNQFYAGGSGMFYLDGDITAGAVDLYIDRDLVLTGNSRIAGDGDMYFMSLYADNSNLTFGGSGQNIYLRGSDVYSNGTDIDFRGRYVTVDNGGSPFIMDTGAGDIYLDILDAGDSDLTIQSGGKLYVANTMGNGAVGLYANYGSLNIGREIITDIVDPSVWFEIVSKRSSVDLADKVTSDAATLINAASNVYVGGDISSAGELYVSGDTVQLDGAVSAGGSIDINGNTQIYLNNNVTADNGDIYLTNSKLTGDVSLSASTGDIYLYGTMDADVHNLTFTGTGDLYLGGDVISANTALDFNRNTYLMNSSYIDAGTADITIGNMSGYSYDLRFGGSGLLNVNGDVSSTTNDLFFDRNMVLTGNSTFSSASGQIVFNGTVDGAYDMGIDTTNDVTFVYPVGDTTRLGNITIANANNVYGDSFKAASFAQSAGTGRTEFANDGLNMTGDIAITTQEIAGAYMGDEGELNSGSGEINATVTFNSLDIDGAGATLTAGSVGTGAVDQTMANRITVGGAPVTTPSSLFTFGGFQIGYVNVVVPPVTPGTGAGGVLPPTVVATISAPSIQLENSFSFSSVSHTVAAACAPIESDVIISDAFFGGSSASATSSDEEERDAYKANSISTSAGAGGIASVGCNV